MQQVKAQNVSGCRPDYKVEQSLVFEPSKGMSSAIGSVDSFTLSFWVKRSSLGTDQHIIGGASFKSDDTFYFNAKRTVTVFRDPSEWIHFVLSDGNLYVNGVLDSSGWSTSFTPSSIGYDPAMGQGLDGYLAELNFIHCQSISPLGPEWFGIVNTCGVYSPIPYEFSPYGDNGFYLKFESSGIGNDNSGNNNNFTPSGFSYDSVVADSPTNNLATLNPLLQRTTGSPTFTYSQGNTVISIGGTGNTDTASTIAVSSGKWYAEVTAITVDGSNTAEVGITGSAYDLNILDTIPKCTYLYSGKIRFNSPTTTLYGDSWASGDVVGIALNLDDSELTFFKNGVSQGVISITPEEYLITSARSSGTPLVAWNFGQQPWLYTPPEGYEAISTNNLP